MLKYYQSFSFCTTYYQKLGVTPTDSIEVIKAAYIKLAKLHHPDVNASTSETKFKEITNAYNILKDPQKRQIYDQSILQGVKTNSTSYTSQNYAKETYQNNGWEFQGGQQRQWQEQKKHTTYRTKTGYRGQQSSTNTIFIIMAFGGICFIIQSIIPEFEDSEKPKNIKATIQASAKINDNPTSYSELKQIYDQLEQQQPQPQRYYTNASEESQTELRRQNVIYQSQNITDSPFILNQRRKMMNEEMKQKKFKIEVETYEKVIKGDSKMLKRKSKNNPPKGDLKTKQGDLTLEGFAKQQQLTIQKSQHEQQDQPTNISIEHLEKGYI